MRKDGVGNLFSRFSFPVSLLSFLISLFSILSFAPAVAAQTPAEELEREAQAIDKMIMCPVCPAETIDQAQVEISFQMRAVVRELLAEGKTQEEVLNYFVERYGPDILAAPPKSGANLVAWILPIVGVVAGVAVLFLIIRAMTGQVRSGAAPSSGRPSASAADSHGDEPGAVAAPPSDSNGADLSAYLAIVDRNLAVRRGMRSGPEGRTAPLLSGEDAAGPLTESRNDG